jgi:hypothetical protein
MGGEGAALGRNTGGAEAADKGQGESAKGGHDVGSLAAAQAGAIFAKGDITDVVPALDGPMATGEGEETRRISLGGRHAGQDETHVTMRSRAVVHRREQTRNLTEVRKGRIARQMSVQTRCWMERARFRPSASAINRCHRADTSRRVREVGAALVVQGGLVFLDDKEIVCVLVEEGVGRLGTRMEGVGGDDARSERQGRQDGASDRDLIRLLVNTYVQERFPTCVR